MKFKLTHPQDLITRLFILEFLREITPEVIYSKANEEQKKQFFITYIEEDESNTEEVEFNWEHLLFKATLPQLEYLLEPHEELVLEIDAKNESAKRKLIEENNSMGKEIGSISIYDMARAEINKMNDTSKLLLPEEKKLIL